MNSLASKRSSLIDPSNATNALNRVYNSLLNVGPTEKQQILFYNLLHMLSGPLTAPTSIEDRAFTDDENHLSSTLYCTKPELGPSQQQFDETQSMAAPSFDSPPQTTKASASADSNYGDARNYFKCNQSTQNASTKASNFEYKYPSSFLPNPAAPKETVFGSGGSLDQYYESRVQNIMHIMQNAENDANREPYRRPPSYTPNNQRRTGSSADSFASATSSLRGGGAGADRKFYEIVSLIVISFCGRMLFYTNRLLTPLKTQIELRAVHYWNEWKQCETVQTRYTILFGIVAFPFFCIGVLCYGCLFVIHFMIGLLLSNVPSHVKQQIL